MWVDFAVVVSIGVVFVEENVVFLVVVLEFDVEFVDGVKRVSGKLRTGREPNVVFGQVPNSFFEHGRGQFVDQVEAVFAGDVEEEDSLVRKTNGQQVLPLKQKQN